MAVNISLDFGGIDKFFLNLIDGQTLFEIYQGVGEHILSAIDDQFETQGEYWGEGWADLSPSYIRSLSRRGGFENDSGDYEMLIRGGEGSEALSQSFSYEVGPEGLEIGSSASYAPYHHFGTGDIPERQLLPNTFEELTEEDIEEIIEVVRIKIEAKLR